MDIKEVKCRNCIFFRKNEYGQMNNDCDSNKFTYHDIKESDQLAYWDAESYKAGIYVGEDFGCIHFKPIQENEK